MKTTTLGRINVTTPGTPVRLASSYTPICHIRAQVIAGLTGKMYIGGATIHPATLAGVIKEFWPNPSGGIDDAWEITAETDCIDLSEYWLDAAVPGEGLLITYWTA